jgi:hypothetical protein
MMVCCRWGWQLLENIVEFLLKCLEVSCYYYFISVFAGIKG